ncbi:MAG: hypothetical protein AAGA87_09045 [Pseudomonadota bacterium]
MTPRAAATRLDAVLEAERQALRSGQIDALASMADEKATLLDALTRKPCPPEVLTQLRQGMERNAKLAAAAAHGIRDAMTRLQDIKQAAGPISGYCDDGTRQNIGSGRPTRDLKA